MNSPSARPLGLIVSASFIATLAANAALADSTGVILSDGDKFLEQTGEAIYANACQCLPYGTGPGRPRRRKISCLGQKRETGGVRLSCLSRYPRTESVPPFGGTLDDEQIAAVVDYIRTHFGNNYTDSVTMDDVKSSR